jgi:hypothetical protein
MGWKKKSQAVEGLKELSTQMAQKATQADLTQLSNEFDQVVANVTVDSEVILARGGKQTLGSRLDKNESVLSIEKSWNIFNKTNALDGKLVNNTPNTTLSDYANSIYSGVVPVEVGTYLISQKLRAVGDIFCYDNTVTAPNYNTGAVCAINTLNGTVGTWGSPTGKITRVNNALSGEYYSTVITISDPNIKFIAWHMHSGSYWAHTTEQFNTLIDSAQVEEGSVRNEYTSYGWENYKIAETALPEQFKKLQNNNVVILKTGTKISARVRFDDTKDLYHLWEYPITNNNLGLNLVDIATCDKTAPYDKLSGTSFKTSGDDIAPLYLNGSYVGANHGFFDVLKLTTTGHGKTTADIGSVWSLNGKNFLILDIVDANTIKIFSDFTGNQTSPTNYTSATSFSGTLTHVSGATNTTSITFTATAKDQIYPMTNNKKFKLVLDGKEITADGVYFGDKFDLIEIYTIMDVPSIQQYIKTNIGAKANLSNDSIAGWVNVTNIFSHNKNGSLTVKTGYEFLKQTNISFYGAVQSFSIGAKAYVPDVGIVDGKDMSTVVTQGANTLDFAKSSWLSPTKPPYRYHQFSTDLTKGMALGYNTSFGVAKPSIRQNDTSAGNIAASTNKMYPYVKASGTAVAGDYQEAIAFRIPLRIIDTDATCLYWYWVGKDIYLAFDYHKNIDKIIELPSYMAGKKIEQLDVHANTSVKSEIVSAKGIKVKVTNNYGYGVLRLYD